MTRKIVPLLILLTFMTLPKAMAKAENDEQHTSHGTQKYIEYIDHATTQTENQYDYPDESPCIKSIKIFETRNADERIITNVSMKFQGGQTLSSCLEFSFTGVSGGDVLSNTSHTLFAINLKTNTMGGTAFVAAVLPTGDIILIKDVQSRLAKAFKVKDIDSVPSYVSNIEGNYIYVSASTSPNAETVDNSTYVIRLDDDGSFKAVRKQKNARRRAS